MEQLEALQKLYESISKGPEVLQGIDPDSIVGKQAHDVAELVRLRQAGREWDSDVCGQLVENVDDVGCLLKIGDICQLTGHWNEAVRGYERVLEKSSDDEVVSVVYNNLGLVYADKGEWDKAIEFYEKDLKISEKVGDVHGMAQTYGNLGSVYADKGEWDKAIEFYEKSLETKEKVGDVHGIAKTYNNLGLVYADKGEWDKAIEFYEKDLKISEKVGDVHGIAQTYGNLGSVYANKGEWDKAIEFHKKDLKISEKVGDVHGMGITYSNIGKLYLENSELQQAKEKLEKSIKLINPDARPDYPNAMNWLALCYTKLAEQKKIESINDAKNRKTLIEKASAYYSCAADKYQETHHLYLARMPESLLVDSHVAYALSIAILNPFIKNDLKAIEGLDSAISELEKALEYADDEAKIKIEGSILGHRARKSVRLVSITKETSTQEELLDEIIQNMNDAARKFEAMGEKGEENKSLCVGCACLYEGLKYLHMGLNPDNYEEFVIAKRKLKESEEHYINAGSRLGTEIITLLKTDLIHKMETSLDQIDKKIQNGEIITRIEIDELYESILEIIEQISFSGLKNLFDAYIFTDMLKYRKLKIEEKRKKEIPQPLIKTGTVIPDIEPMEINLKVYLLEVVILAILINALVGFSLNIISEEIFNQYKYYIISTITILIIIVLFNLKRSKQL